MPYDGLQGDDDPQCLTESWAWLQANQCRRLGFTMLYDSDTVSCAQLPNAHFCDFCEPQSKLMVRLKKEFQPTPHVLIHKNPLSIGDLESHL